MNKKIIYILGAFVALMSIVYLSGSKAHANPSIFPSHSSCVTAVSTTSISYMTAGTATTTLTCDSYTLQVGQPDNYAINSAVLATQYSASSTASILNMTYEYSNDGIDWYSNDLSAQATTSPVQNIQTAQSFTWPFASSTPNGSSPAGTNLSKKVVTLPVPSRYVRVVYTVPVGAAAGGIWAEILPEREVPNY